jgi:type IV secretory pathway ATPase VirB11/archaellum biosynthesis ATPase
MARRRVSAYDEAVQLSPSLRALLGSLESHLDNSTVQEVLIVAPDRALVCRDGQSEEISAGLTKAKLQSLAERVQKDSMLGEAFSIVVVSGVAASPIIRIARRPSLGASLTELARDGSLGPGAEALLCETDGQHRSLLIVGRRASGKTALLAAIARHKRSKARVVAFERAPHLLERSGAVHASLDESAGLEAAMALGADVIIADDPSPRLLLDLVLQGRPFLASIEGNDSQSGLMRVSARLLSADASLSKIAAEALLQSTLDLVIETASERGSYRVKSVLEIGRERSAVTAQPASSRGEPADEQWLDETPPIPSRELGSSAPPVVAPPAKSMVGSTGPSNRPGSGADARREPRPSPRRPLSAPAARARTPSSQPSLREDPRPLAPSEAAPPTAAKSERALDLTSPVAISNEASDPHEDSNGLMVFNPQEVSEIRPEQLVSHSFVMSLKDIEGDRKDRSAARVVALDPGSQADEEQTLDGEAAEGVNAAIGRDPSVKSQAANPLLPPSRALADPLSGSGAPIVERERVLEIPPLADPSDDLVSAIDRAPPPAGVSHGIEADPAGPSSIAAGVPYDPFGGSSSEIFGQDLVTSGGAIVSRDGSAEMNDLLGPAGGRDTAAAVPLDPIRPNGGDLESTQSARLEEMVFGFAERERGFEGFESVGTITPEESESEQAGEARLGAPSRGASDDDDPKRSRPFEEMTPVWPLADRAPPPASPNREAASPSGSAAARSDGASKPSAPAAEAKSVGDAGIARALERPKTIDPIRAAKVSIEEFDALLEELRDVTNSSFDPDREATETGTDDPDLGPKSRGRIVASDIKRRSRLRGP